MSTFVVIGIDLTGSDKRPSTLAMLKGNSLYIYDFRDIEEMINFIVDESPKVVAIDAPFQLPRKGAFRDCDKKMKKMGMKPLPPVWRGMRKLVARARKLIENLKFHEVIETFPMGALNLLRIKDIKSISSQLDIFNGILQSYKFKLSTKTLFKKDVLDSVICVIAALNYVRKGEIVEIRDEEGCRIIIPRLSI